MYVCIYVSFYVCVQLCVYVALYGSVVPHRCVIWRAVRHAQLLFRLYFTGTLTPRGRLLLSSGYNLQRWYDIIREEQRIFSPEVRSELFYCCQRFLVQYQAAGCHETPKFHMFMHLSLDTLETGNPAYFHTYPDESLNGMLSKVARSTHPRTFCLSVFQKIFAAGSLLNPTGFVMLVNSSYI